MQTTIRPLNYLSISQNVIFFIILQTWHGMNSCGRILFFQNYACSMLVNHRTWIVEYLWHSRSSILIWWLINFKLLFVKVILVIELDDSLNNEHWEVHRRGEPCDVFFIILIWHVFNCGSKMWWCVLQSYGVMWWQCHLVHFSDLLIVSPHL